ncbi:hypothetical protein LGK95_17160 [Clostridium algoriphilum]|uniref:hypothetical protein n=1 Tax=Clostridium algoriphilum TaxID=198347 RepID=UPI001CF5CF06|nr:hypothetical protein [Clostridium algoriphilum]MCB2295215.1 hypothetical protein [Clostridium algoriphilum]
MGFLEELRSATIESISKAATNAFCTVVVSSQDDAKINDIKTELTAIDGELDVAYKQIGEKYFKYISETKESPVIEVEDILNLMEPKQEKRNEMKAQLAELEKKVKDQVILQEKEKFENEFKRQKDALDRAKSIDVISEDEYNSKLKEYTKKLENFQAIRNVKKQYELGIISYNELQMKLRELT